MSPVTECGWEQVWLVREYFYILAVLAAIVLLGYGLKALSWWRDRVRVQAARRAHGWQAIDVAPIMARLADVRRNQLQATRLHNPSEARRRLRLLELARKTVRRFAYFSSGSNAATRINEHDEVRPAQS